MIAEVTESGTELSVFSLGNSTLKAAFRPFGSESTATLKIVQEYSPFANGYLQVTCFVGLSTKKLPIPLPVFKYFELIKVTATDLPNSNSAELPKSYRFVTPGNYASKKLPIPLPIFIILN